MTTQTDQYILSSSLKSVISSTTPASSSIGYELYSNTFHFLNYSIIS